MTVIVIGAGMAGLAAAIDLAVVGEAVTMLDAAAGPGGKMSEAIVGDAAIDAGPTVLTMADVFVQLFADAGDDLARHLQLTPASILARHFWGDGSRLDLLADPDRTHAAITDFAGTRDAAGYRAFARAGRRIHRALDGTFMRADKPATPLSLMWRGGIAGLAGFTQLDPYRPLAAMIADHFGDPRLRQLFGRYTTYCGSSPFRSPATLALIAEVERAGVWLVDGGMRRLAEALDALARRLGVGIAYDTPVARVLADRGRTTGVELADGRRLAADAVVVAADAAALAAGRFGPTGGLTPFAPEDRSYSAFTVALIGQVGEVPLTRHNIFFSDDSAAEFAALDAGGMPEDPTVYLCAQDRGAGEHDDAPRGQSESMLLVLNAPADGDTHLYSSAEIERWTTAAFTRLNRSGLSLNPADCRCSISTPSDFERRFPATGGALYGRASHGWTASFRRPGARTRMPGLYCAGGSVHPGAGVPMAALSGRAAARALIADRASTSIFRRAAMPGGMSMRSAMTADTA
jgi:1-hydroxycarotenoid 3,4-desaturase